MSQCIETCKNPFKHEVCPNTNIKVYIQLTTTKRGKSETNNYPVCEECWIKLAKSNKEWGTSTDTILKPIMIKGKLPEELEKTLTIIDTMTIGKLKVDKDAPTENDEEAY